jgi:hypothetical protein
MSLLGFLQSEIGSSQEQASRVKFATVLIPCEIDVSAEPFGGLFVILGLIEATPRSESRLRLRCRGQPEVVHFPVQTACLLIQSRLHRGVGQVQAGPVR